MVKSGRSVRIGVVSDTHGYLDAHVLEAFSGVDHIIHAGDIMDAATLTALAAVAPVTAVAGNMDDGKLGKLPREVAGEVGGVRFIVGHKRKRLLKRLSNGKIEGIGKHDLPELVVCGHDHLPAVEWVDGTLYLDPGSASAPHYEDDDPTVAIVETGPAGLDVRFIRIPRRVEDEA
jgi:putative phosphoesterase